VPAQPGSSQIGRPFSTRVGTGSRVQSLAGLACFLLTALAAAAQGMDPRVPPGRDPGGVAVALLSSGIDYTLPEIASRLARDGEGEIIAWDFIDNDNRPFDAGGGQTPPNRGGDAADLVAQMTTAATHSRVRLIPVRVDPADAGALGRAVAFVARTPARVVAVPMWSDRAEDWELFRRAASHFTRLLFVVAAGDGGRDVDREPVWPAAFKLPNVLVVTSATRHAGGVGGVQLSANQGAATVDAAVSLRESRSRTGELGARRGSGYAVATAAWHAACLARADSRANGATLKQMVLASGRPADSQLALAARHDLTEAVCATGHEP
jgi:hypothetical protein